MIIGTSLAGLMAAGGLGSKSSSGTSVLSGLLGTSDTTTDYVTVPTPMPVTERQYYEDTIGDMKQFFTYAQGVCDRICDLEQRVAVDETSISKNFEFMSNENSWQNKFFEEQMRYADLLEQCRINEATCKCIKGDVYASPQNLADPYVGRPVVLGSYLANFYDNGLGYTTYGTGTGCACAYNGYNYNF
jgi:hypothetical protein